MGQIEDLQNKGFGSHGGKQYTIDHDITPLKKRVLMDWLNFLDIIKPKTNEPIIEVKILLFINSRVTDAKNATNIINKEFLIFIYKQFL